MLTKIEIFFEKLFLIEPKFKSFAALKSSDAGLKREEIKLCWSLFLKPKHKSYKIKVQLFNSLFINSYPRLFKLN